MVHGQTPEDVKTDIEGLRIMRTLGRNMAFFLKCKEAGIKAGITLLARKGRNYIHKFHSVKEVLFYDNYRNK